MRVDDLLVKPVKSPCAGHTNAFPPRFWPFLLKGGTIAEPEISLQIANKNRSKHGQACTICEEEQNFRKTFSYRLWDLQVSLEDAATWKLGDLTSRLEFVSWSTFIVGMVDRSAT